MEREIRRSVLKRLIYLIVLTTFVILIEALVVAFVTKTGRDHGEHYFVRIKEIGSNAMLVHSTSGELGYGENLLIYDAGMALEDVNGNAIGLRELDVGDWILITINPREKHPEYSYDLDPVAKKIILLAHDVPED